MLKIWPYCVLAGLAFATAAGPATAQFPPGPDESGKAATGEPPGKGRAKKVAPEPPSGVGVKGSWSGELTQVGSQTPYRVDITVGAHGAETRYPDLDCTGRLSRVGAAGAYVFFAEAITKGQAEKGGRCPDGTITIARQGDELAVGWFGSVQGNTIVAYGNLKKK